MKRNTVISFVAALVTFLVLCALLSGAADDAGLLATLDPVSAVKGLAFALAFGAGVPAKIAMPIAIAALVLAPVAAFLGAHRFLRRDDN